MLFHFFFLNEKYGMSSLVLFKMSSDSQISFAKNQDPRISDSFKVYSGEICLEYLSRTEPQQSGDQ